MDKSHNFHNFTKIGWVNEREGNTKKKKKTCLCILKCLNLVTRTTFDWQNELDNKIVQLILYWPRPRSL